MPGVRCTSGVARYGGSGQGTRQSAAIVELPSVHWPTQACRQDQRFDFILFVPASREHRINSVQRTSGLTNSPSVLGNSLYAWGGGMQENVEMEKAESERENPGIL